MRSARSELALASVIALTAPLASAQISPGKLSQAHSALEGSAKCLQCHEAGRGPTPAKCLACHPALGERIAGGKGLHARPDHRDCKTCHVEHQGLEYDLIWWGKVGRKAFDHSQTGYRLEGRHTGLTCEACHQERLGGQRQALAGRGVNVSRTFLGLRTACASCHADEHNGQFEGRDCASCHADIHRGQFTKNGQTPCSTCHMASGWTDLLFKHDQQSSFALTGAHRQVACGGCHRPERAGDTVFVRFKPLPTACESCHQGKK